MEFGKAIEVLKQGGRVARKGWNGKGIFLGLQKPTEGSSMTHDYIYIDTTGLQTDNPDAPKDRVPWLASQTDMLAEDWYGVGRTAEKPFEGTVMVHPIRPVPQINVTFNGVPTSFNTDEIRKALENATEAFYQSSISTLTD